MFKKRLDKSHSRVRRSDMSVIDFQVSFTILPLAFFDYAKMFYLNICAEPSVLAAANTLHVTSITILLENRDPFKLRALKHKLGVTESTYKEAVSYSPRK